MASEAGKAGTIKMHGENPVCLQFKAGTWVPLAYLATFLFVLPRWTSLQGQDTRSRHERCCMCWEGAS